MPNHKVIVTTLDGSRIIGSPLTTNWRAEDFKDEDGDVIESAVVALFTAYSAEQDAEAEPQNAYNVMLSFPGSGVRKFYAVVTDNAAQDSIHGCTMDNLESNSDWLKVEAPKATGTSSFARLAR